MALPGYALGDVRFAHLGAIAMSAILVAYARPRRRSPPFSAAETFGPAAILLFTPTVFYQVRGAWNEPFLLLLACATVFLATRRKLTAAAATLGLFLVAKQYAPLALAATPMLAPAVPRRRWTLLIAMATLAGAAVTLPLALWDARAFVHSQTSLFVGVVRQDSISFAPILARATGWRPTLWWPALEAVAAGTMMLLAVPRARRGPATFAAAAAFLLLCAFAVSTQAFGNYYFLAAGMLLCAAAAAGASEGNATCETSPC